jgi:hypothetical protein
LCIPDLVDLEYTCLRILDLLATFQLPYATAYTSIMALTIKHLNDDASFLLSFEPVTGLSTRKTEPFRILLDPWITGSSSIFHPKISISHPKNQACIASVAELPEPDLVIISQDKTDHCNEATLRQLPATGTKTVILAEPTSARLIRSWKYFDEEKVKTIPKWEDPRVTGRESVVRIPIKPIIEGGQAGEVTIAFIPQPKDISGLLNAVGITYRAPSTSPTLSSPTLSPPISPMSPTLSPPMSPISRKSYTHLPRMFSYSSTLPSPGELSPTSPISPGFFSLRSVRSTSSIKTAATAITIPPTSPPNSTLSVIFSPHGISYPSLHTYATSHLTAEYALPLTALLHCFDSVTNPWWLGGKVLLGAPAGTETASRLKARVWISAHDGDKEVKGLATGFLKIRKWAADELGRQLAEDGEESEITAGRRKGTEVLALGIGEEVVLDCEGVCDGGKREGGQDLEREMAWGEKDVGQVHNGVTRRLTSS